MFNYKLHEITQILQSEEGRTITMQVERKGVILKFKFRLKKNTIKKSHKIAGLIF